MDFKVDLKNTEMNGLGGGREKLVPCSLTQDVIACIGHSLITKIFT